MLRKLFFLVLLSVSASVIVVAQQLPAPRGEGRAAFIFGGNGGYLGVQTQEITKENFAKFGLNEVRGVAVEKVVENSPAAQAGLENNDVIIRFNSEAVSSARQLTRLISEIAPDHKANLTVLRGGNERDFSVILGKREVPGFDMSNSDFENYPPFPSIRRMPFPSAPNSESRVIIRRLGERRQIGIDVTPLTTQLGDFFGVANGKGLLVDSVRADSPAAKAGLKAGDVITEADGKEVAGNADLIRVINEKKEGSITLTIVREKNRQTLTVTPEKVKGAVTPYFEEFDEFNPPSNFKIVVLPNAPQAPISPRVN